MSTQHAAETFVERVQAWIAEQRLLEGGESVLVAVSGGADSVALLRTLQALAPALPLTLTVAHVHHGVRGAQADRDQRFAESLAARCGCRYMTRRLAPLPGDNEEALRDARYDALQTLAREAGAPVIAVGHTLDDHVETVLMRIIRGTGLEGLQGIPVTRAMSRCRLIRPLRDVWRTDVETWLRALRQPWCEDETNAAPTWLRNRLRHALLPLLAAEYNPQVKRSLRQLADTATMAWRHIVAEADAWLDVHSARTDDGADLRLPLAPLLSQSRALQQAILRQGLCRAQGHLRRFTYQHWLAVEATLLQRPVGSLVDLPGGLQLEKQADALLILTTSQNGSFSV